jgi:hypothetical protein
VPSSSAPPSVEYPEAISCAAFAVF